MQTISDIMIKDVQTCPLNGTLLTGHKLMKEKDIRHLPVVNETGELYGVLGQKEVLKEVFTIINDRGTHRLDHYEDKIPIKNIMGSATSISPDTPLDKAGEFFLKNKAGCLMVTDENNKLVGVVSSHDFVKLSINLLKH